MREKYINSIIFKSKVLLYRGSTIKKEYDNDYKNDSYKFFIKGYDATQELDQNFFYLEKEIPVRIQGALNSFRNEKDKYDDYDNDKVNDIISEMNLKKTISLKDRIDLVNAYWEREEEERELIFEEPDDLLAAVRNDALIYDVIKKDKEPDGLDEDEELYYQFMLFQHIITFVNKCPSLFQDEEFRNNTLKRMNPEELKTRELKRRAKSLKKQINNK